MLLLYFYTFQTHAENFTRDCFIFEEDKENLILFAKYKFSLTMLKGVKFLGWLKHEMHLLFCLKLDDMLIEDNFESRAFSLHITYKLYILAIIVD